MNARRLLIVSPHFPPVNAPDMQRVRMSLPYLVSTGWEVTVLTVDDPTPLAPIEPELLATVPENVKVVRARCCSRRWMRWLGVNNVALRALPFLFLTGCRLLAGRRYDAVYFSTTMFIVLPFGRIWRRLYGTPYVIDLQDPWVTDFYEQPGAPRPPGGWKYRVARNLGLLLEGWTMCGAAHLITVSAAYGVTLRSRYADLKSLPCTELPFGSPDPDLRHLRTTLAQRPAVLPLGGFRLAFAGALGPGSLPAVETLFAAMAKLRAEGGEISAHFFGTSYAQTGQSYPAILALAERHGLQKCVHEQPARLPYFAALQITLEADANLLFGSTDAGFMPSKLLALLGAGRPVVAIAHTRTALTARLKELAIPCTLMEGDRPTADAVAATATRLRQLINGNDTTVTQAVPAHLAAENLAAAQAEILASVSAGRT